MYAFLLLTLMPGDADQDARAIIAEIRARQIVSEIQNTDPLQQKPKRGMSYAEARASAIRDNKPLIVVVQQGEVTEEPGYLYLYVNTFDGINRPATVVSKPINGDLWWITTLEKYNSTDVVKVINTP